MRIATANLLVFLFSYFGFNSTLLSQKNFVDGYIVTKSGDTLVGEIDFRDQRKISDAISFRKAEGDQTSTFHPYDLRSFAVG